MLALYPCLSFSTMKRQSRKEVTTGVLNLATALTTQTRPTRLMVTSPEPPSGDGTVSEKKKYTLSSSRSELSGIRAAITNRGSERVTRNDVTGEATCLPHPRSWRCGLFILGHISSIFSLPH